MIHIIGNSHAYLFTGNQEMIPFVFETLNYANNIEGIKSYRFSSTLAYNLLSKDIENIIKFLSNHAKNDDYIGLLYGEVDCRWWIPYVSNKENRFITDEIIRTAEEYFKCFLELKKIYNNIVCIGVHPSGNNKHCEDKDSPVFRECLYRNYISREFNNNLIKNCQKNNIIYIECFNEFLNSDGTTNNYWFKDYCHLNQKALSRYLDKFKEINLI